LIELIFSGIRKFGFLIGLKIQIEKVTSKEELTDFLQKLYPVKVNKDLIRVGSEGDGGYLVPDDLEGVYALFSPGVGSKQDFDLECAKKGIKVFMADASVDGPVSNHENYFFTKKFISSLDNYDYMSIDKWVENSDISDSSDLILQMDIEGYEYETIYSMSRNNINKFRIILIEFHHLDMLWDKFYFEKFKNTFLKLLQTHYVVHIHPNNCCKVYKRGGISIPPVMEFTFIRKDRVDVCGYSREYPNKLDADCANKKSLILPPCWYKND